VVKRAREKALGEMPTEESGHLKGDKNRPIECEISERKENEDKGSLRRVKRRKVVETYGTDVNVKQSCEL